MPKTLEYTGKVVIVNCWCGIRHGIPDDLWKLAGRKKEAQVRRHMETQHPDEAALVFNAR